MAGFARGAWQTLARISRCTHTSASARCAGPSTPGQGAQVSEPSGVAALPAGEPPVVDQILFGTRREEQQGGHG